MKNKLFFTLIYMLYVSSDVFAQMPIWYGKKGVQVVTCRADADNEYSMGLLDTRDRTSAPLSLDWAPTMYHHPTWTRSNLGQVFGITMDGSNNIFVTASSSYGMPNAYNSSTLTGKYGPSGSGAIYKIDAVTGVITTFTVIPQDQTVLVVDDTGPNSALVDKDGIRVGAGLGNICYDADHDQFFVTSFDDGKIYRISSSGTILNSFDPVSCSGCISDPSPTDTGDNDQISPLGDRPWGIGYYGGKLYFSIWTEDRRTSNPAPLLTSFNQIFSVGLDGSGNFSGIETVEVTLPGFKKDNATNPDIYSNPVSDIEFDDSGNMAMAERGMVSDVDASAHRAGVFYLIRSGAGSYISPTNYPVSPPYIRIGTSPGNDNGSGSGGVDFSYDGYDTGSMEASGNLSYIWATGHRLREDADDGGPGGPDYILSGTQMSPVAGWSPNGDFWQYSYFADFDGIPDRVNKTAQGDVDVIRGITLPPSPNCQLSMTFNTSNCNAQSNTYTLSGTLNFVNPPATGTLTVSVSGGGSQSFTAPFTSPLNYSIGSLFANGMLISVIASFSDDTNCVGLGNYQAPVSCFVNNCPNVQNTMCTNESYTLTAPAGLINVMWYDSTTNTLIGSGFSLVIPGTHPTLSDGFESFYYTAFGVDGCPIELCCPVRVAVTTISCNITITSQPSCADLTGGSITVNPSPVGPTYTYNWSDIGSGSAMRTGLMGGTYTVTVTNTATGCTGVCNVTLTTPTNCCNINAVVPQNPVCLDNGTPAIHTDNRIRFSANVTNTNTTLTAYNVSINGGTTITPNTNVPYGLTQFTLGPGTAGGGATFTITVTDSVTPGCTQTFQVLDPGGCNNAIPCPTPNCGTATIQTNGN